MSNFKIMPIGKMLIESNPDDRAILLTDATPEAGDLTDIEPALAAALEPEFNAAKDRANHTGTQPAATISDFASAATSQVNAMATITGAKTFSGLVSGAGQTPDSPNNFTTVAIGDARYGVRRVGYASATQDVTNSAAPTDSTFLVIPLDVGTWQFETLEVVGSSAFATAGAQTSLAFTGTGTFSGQRWRNGSSNIDPINITPNWGGPAETVQGLIAMPTQSLIGIRRGRIVVTAPGNLVVRFAQNTAVAAHFVRMHIGSRIEAYRIN